MKIAWAALVIAALLSATVAAGEDAETERVVYLQFELFTIQGPAKGRISLDGATFYPLLQVREEAPQGLEIINDKARRRRQPEIIEIEQPEPKDLRTRDAVTPFSHSDVQLGPVRLIATPSLWKFNGENDPVATEGFETIAAPRIMTLDGRAAEIRIGSEGPIAYLEDAGEGLYRKATLDQPTGLALSVTPEIDREGRVKLNNLKIESCVVEDREPVPGLDLPVGKPVLHTQRFRSTFTVSPGSYHGILVRTAQGEGALLVRLKTEIVEDLRVPEQPPR